MDNHLDNHMDNHETLPWPEGLKRTKQREAILAALSGEVLPVTALCIFEKLQQAGEPIWLSTVYRVLETFVEKGAVIKYVLTDSTMAVYELNCHLHKHYAVCVECHRMIPVDTCPIEDSLSSLMCGKFHVSGHNLELFGYCEECWRKCRKEP